MDLRIEGLRCERGGRVVLDIPLLRIRGDVTTVVLGPNGAGKTTLLRALAGLDRPDGGRVVAEDRGAGPPAPADLAYVFQEDVFLRRSVRENLEVGLRLRGVPAEERQVRIDAAADLLGIRPLLHRPAAGLSGGEGRRASLARALCLRAPLALLDEPLAGLDHATYSRLLDELPRVLAAFRSTTVLVTHDHREAERLGEDLVVLVDGAVRAAGDRQTVFARPADASVAVVLGYLVLEQDRRRFAVRPAALAPGPGPVEFWLDVEEAPHTVGAGAIAGTIGSTRVRVPIAGDLPCPQGRVLVHATSAVELA